MSSKHPNTDWFNDPGVLASLPPLYRFYALYSRWAVDNASGRIPGGSFLLRRLAWLTSRFGLRDSAVITRSNRKIAVDLCDSRMLLVMHEILGTNEEGDFLRTVLREGDTFLDVGANHGSFAVIACSIVGTTGSVLAFEPQPRLASLLALSFQANGFPQGEVHSVALGAIHGQSMTFYLPDSGSGSGGLYRSFSGHQAHRQLNVNVVRFDDWIGCRVLPGQLVVKLDVEGSECAFLEGARATLISRKPTVLFELNPTAANAGGYSTEKLLQAFEELGYSEFSPIGALSPRRTAAGIDCQQQQNVVAWPPPKP